MPFLKFLYSRMETNLAHLINFNSQNEVIFPEDTVQQTQRCHKVFKTCDDVSSRRCQLFGNENYTNVSWQRFGNVKKWRCINVVTTSQSQKFTKYLTMSSQHWVNVVSANILVFLVWLYVENRHLNMYHC